MLQRQVVYLPNRRSRRRCASQTRRRPWTPCRHPQAQPRWRHLQGYSRTELPGRLPRLKPGTTSKRRPSPGLSNIVLLSQAICQRIPNSYTQRWIACVLASTAVAAAVAKVLQLTRGHRRIAVPVPSAVIKQHRADRRRSARWTRITVTRAISVTVNCCPRARVL